MARRRVRKYTTQVPASRSIHEIQEALVQRGADGIMFTYEPGGRIASLVFRLTVGPRPISFALPVEWRRFQALMKKQGIKNWRDEDYVYRVTWRVLQEWTMAQLALLDTQMVDLPQVFLPFAVVNGGTSVYNVVIDGKLLAAPEARP